MKPSLPLLASLLLVAACQPAAPADQSAAAVTAVTAADAAWERAVAGHDTLATIAAVEATGSVLSPNAPIATGPAAIRTMFDGVWALPGLKLSWHATRVEAARSGELAYSSGTYEMTITGPKGTPITDKGKYSTVWRKQADGSWKVVLDTFNSDMPAAGM